jgi:hypothetical protein
MDVEIDGRPGGHAPGPGSVGLDADNRLQAIAEPVGQVLARCPEPGSGPAASVHAAGGDPQLQAGA